jgi:hypothetical protein
MATLGVLRPLSGGDAEQPVQLRESAPVFFGRYASSLERGVTTVPRQAPNACTCVRSAARRA